MALDISLQSEVDDADDADDLYGPAAESDPASEEALMHAVHSWRAMRARFAEVNPALLGRPSRVAYARLMGSIGLWADARAFGGPIDPNDETVS